MSRANNSEEADSYQTRFSLTPQLQQQIHSESVARRIVPVLHILNPRQLVVVTKSRSYPTFSCEVCAGKHGGEKALEVSNIGSDCVVTLLVVARLC